MERGRDEASRKRGSEGRKSDTRAAGRDSVQDLNSRGWEEGQAPSPRLINPSPALTSSSEVHYQVQVLIILQQNEAAEQVRVCAHKEEIQSGQPIRFTSN